MSATACVTDNISGTCTVMYVIMYSDVSGTCTIMYSYALGKFKNYLNGTYTILRQFMFILDTRICFLDIGLYPGIDQTIFT